MLRTLFHLQGQVQARGHDQKWVGVAYGDLGIESPNIQLCSCKSLLSRCHASPKTNEVCILPPPAAISRQTFRLIDAIRTYVY